jgi:poly-gamma-glutamate capsule biosynthesis protein CapA/YwtB (metallophosphatase superfamily)
MKSSTSLKIFIPLLCMVAVVITVYHKFPSLFGSRTSVSKFSDITDGSLQNYYNLAQGLNPRGSTATTSAVFLAVGDIMLSRNVAAAANKAGDVDYPFYKMSDILKSTDFNFANLESPVAPLPKNEIIGGHSLIFSSPTSSVQGLKDYYFKILNLANNHAFDEGLAGVDATRSALNNLNILHEGTGDNLDQAWAPAVVASNGIKVCFIGASFSSVNDGGKTTNNYVARIEDVSRLKSAILNLKSVCDFIVVTMHAGTEYTRTPNAAQTAFAHAAIDDGADMVIGAHPHWVQTVEKYQGKYIFYSLGNFIFDQAWSQDTKEGLTLKITLSKLGSRNPQTPGAANLNDLQGSRIPVKLESIELLPVIIENSQPRPATADEAKKILNKIGQKETILK